jgi:hypothetical protein
MNHLPLIVANVTSLPDSVAGGPEQVSVLEHD